MVEARSDTAPPLSSLSLSRSRVQIPESLRELIGNFRVCGQNAHLLRGRIAIAHVNTTCRTSHFTAHTHTPLKRHHDHTHTHNTTATERQSKRDRERRKGEEMKEKMERVLLQKNGV